MDSQAAPVIIHHFLRNSPVATCLAQQLFKVRVSETTSERSVIFPKSKVAFYYLHVTPTLLSDVDTPQQRSGLLHSVARFVEVHAHCYVFMAASSHDEGFFTLLGDIQTRHLNSRLQVIPVQNAGEAANAMVDIAKLQCSPLAGKMHARFCLLLNRLLLEETCPRVLTLLDLDPHHILQLVQDGVGSLSKLAQASLSHLMDCALDRHTALQLTHFFRRPL